MNRSAILVVIMVLTSWVIQAQKYAVVMIQSPSNAGYDQYYSGKYGLKTWLDKELDWEEVEEDLYFNLKLVALVELMVVDDEDWKKMTLAFIIESGRRDDDVLFVYVGHNALMEVEPDTVVTNCCDNMIFACMSKFYFDDYIDNTLVCTTNLLAPEAYAVYPSIMGWFYGEDEHRIRLAASFGYAKYQGIPLEESKEIFDYHLPETQNESSLR